MAEQNNPNKKFAGGPISIILGILLIALVLTFLTRGKNNESVNNNPTQNPTTGAEDVETAPLASLKLSSTNTEIKPGETFTVDITLDTRNVDIDGLDIYFLRFDKNVLQVVDGDTKVSGIQIAGSSLLPVTVVNSVDNTNGTVKFSQAVSGGTKYKGTGKIASVTFKAASSLTSGTALVSIDHTKGSTLDSNVSASGKDILSTVQNLSLATRP